MRINMAADVAMPRSFHPTLAWTETMKAVLQNPMPTPSRKAPPPAQIRPLAGVSIINTKLPMTRQTPPIVAANR